MPTAVDITPALKQKIYRYIQENGYITNRRCRETFGLSYDQCITLFNHLVETGEVLRTGKASGTRYVLPK